MEFHQNPANYIGKNDRTKTIRAILELARARPDKLKARLEASANAKKRSRLSMQKKRNATNAQNESELPDTNQNNHISD